MPEDRAVLRGIAVVGSYNQDFVWRTDHFPVPGETRLGRFSTGPGGKGFNQAVAAARQGANVVFIGALGRDAIGQGAARLAQDEGIDARWQWCDDHPSGNAAIVLDAAGQNLIVVGSGANLALSSTHVEAQREALAAVAVMLTQHEVAPAATRRALELARAAGRVTVHNPAPPLAGEDGGLLPLVDVLTPNETEFAHLLAHCAGVTVTANELGDMTNDALHALARRLGVPTVVITLGASGAFVSHADPLRWRDARACYRVPAAAVQPRDTTGAGDAFSGSLAAALAQLGDAPFASAIGHAIRTAGLATESPGAASAMPTREAVRERFG
jgi:ribokinase